MKRTYLILCVALVTILVGSCKEKNVIESPSTYSIRMTDAPAPYNAVLIDLQGVEIKGNNGSTVSMNVNAGIYNLLDFSNGMDTLIATGSLNLSTVSQIRLILGPNNSIVVDGVSYPLSTPSAEQSGLKLQVHQTLQPGVAYAVLLDFDANQSIIQTGNGSYKLKPVIRTIETAISGSIKGQVLPAGVISIVSATSGTTYSSNTNINGEFIIQGLPAGIYSVTITPVAPFEPVTIDNISVTVGAATDIGIVNL